jgi:hypothetical protein
MPSCTSLSPIAHKVTSDAVGREHHKNTHKRQLTCWPIRKVLKTAVACMAALQRPAAGSVLCPSGMPAWQATGYAAFEVGWWDAGDAALFGATPPANVQMLAASACEQEAQMHGGSCISVLPLHPVRGSEHSLIFPFHLSEWHCF